MATTTPPGPPPADTDPSREFAPAVEGLEINEPRRRRLFLLLALLVLAAGLYILVRLLGSQLGSEGEDTPIEESPGVVDLDLTEARADLEELGFVAIAVFEENDRQPENIVFDQTPPGGTKLEVGSEVTLRVSTGAGAVPVPQVVGLEVGPASSLLEASGFLVEVREEFHDTVDLDVVIRQDPPARTDVPIASAVTITVSLGGEPIELPDLEGASRRDAVAGLTRLGFELAFFEEVSDAPKEEDRIPEGSVIRTDPAAGEKLVPGSIVSVILSTGEFIRIPNVVGFDGGAAVAVLLGRGLDVEPLLTPLPAGNENDGLVLKMNPEAGEDARRRDKIQITIGIAEGSPEPGPTTPPESTVPDG